MAFQVEEPRDTHGRWVRIGRGDLEKLMHAAVHDRAHDIAQINGHGEAKARDIQAHLRRQALKDVKAAPVYNVRVEERRQVGGDLHRMVIGIHIPGQDAHRRIDIPVQKRFGNLEQGPRAGKPAEGEIDRPEVHGAAQATGDIAARMQEAAPLGPSAGFAARQEYQRGVQAAAHQVAERGRQKLGRGEETALPEQQARQMEAAGAAGNVGAQAAKQAAQLIREQGGQKEARRVAKGAAKKALEQAFGTAAKDRAAADALKALDEQERELAQGKVARFKDLGQQGGINGGKAAGYINGQRVFIKLDEGAYAGHLRAGIPTGRPDGPPERGAYLVGNLMGVDGGINGKMPIVLHQDIVTDDGHNRGKGMIKQWVNGRPAHGQPSNEYKTRKLWNVFDFAIANLDRHGNNHIEAENEIDFYPMDHGLAFPDDDDHRGIERNRGTVSGRTFTPQERQALQNLADNRDALSAQLRQSGLREGSVASFWGRVDNALRAGRFPTDTSEAARWGKPGVAVNPGEVAAAAAQSVANKGYNRAARANFRRQIVVAAGHADVASRRRGLEALMREAQNNEALAAGNVARDPQAGYDAGRWRNIQDGIKEKIAALPKDNPHDVAGQRLADAMAEVQAAIRAEDRGFAQQVGQHVQKARNHLHPDYHLQAIEKLVAAQNVAPINRAIMLQRLREAQAALEKPPQDKLGPNDFPALKQHSDRAAGLVARGSQLDKIMNERKQIEARIAAGHKATARSDIRRAVKAAARRNDVVELGHLEALARQRKRAARGAGVPAWQMVHENAIEHRANALARVEEGLKQGAGNVMAPRDQPNTASRVRRAEEVRHEHLGRIAAENVAIPSGIHQADRQKVISMALEAKAAGNIALLRRLATHALAQSGRTKAQGNKVRQDAWLATHKRIAEMIRSMERRAA